MSSPPKKKKVEKFQLDNLERAEIRRCIHQFHIDYKTSPTITLKKIHQVLIRRINFGRDKSSLRRILHTLGFRWKKTEDYKKILIEKDSIRAKRPGYLNEIANYRVEGRPIVFTIETFIDNPDLKLSTISEDNETIQVILECGKPETTRIANLEKARKDVQAMLESSGETIVEDIETKGEATLEESDKSNEVKPEHIGELRVSEDVKPEAFESIDAELENCDKVSEAKLEASTPEISLDAMLEESERHCEAMLEEYDKRNRDTAEMPGEMTLEAMLAETSGNITVAASEAKSEDAVKSNDSEEDALEKIIKFTLEKISKPIACTSRETGEIIQCTSKETGEPFVCTSMKMCKSVSKETGEPIESTSRDCAPPTPCVKATRASPEVTDNMIEATLEEIFKECEATQEDGQTDEAILATNPKTEETSLPVEAKSDQSTSKGTDKATEIKDEAVQATSTSAESDKPSTDPISNISRLNVVVAVGEDLYSPNSLLIYEAKPKANGSYKTSSKTYERWLNEKLLPKLQPKSVIVVDMDSAHNKETNCVPSWYTSTKAAMEAWLTKNNISFVPEMCRAELFQLIRMNKKDHVKEYLLDKVLRDNGHVVLRRLSNHQDLNPLETIWSKVQANISLKLIDNFKTKSIRGVLNDAIKEMVKKHWAYECAKVKKREEKYMKFEYIMDDITDNIALLDEDQPENCSHSDSSSDTDMFCELDSDDDWSDMYSSSSASGSSYTSWDDISQSEDSPKSTDHVDPSEEFFTI